ncbi:hypothetical protein SAMN04488529_12123 [Clostridium gasigenes]|uniref:Uncharacterized protein n=1 Tax=Clostridium gasigenes TaxID=94869 RepID=A0A1H0VX80_9CLOT|nr:hypothetical protein SAMN04488529_12123 [Clostridium gasigenes]
MYIHNRTICLIKGDGFGLSKKVDKGFESIYWNLSYRRRFIRDLWMWPWTIISIVFIFCIGDSIFMNRVVPVIVLVIGIVQSIYDYRKWKKCEQS